MPSITILLLVLVNIVSGSHRVNTVLCYSSHGGGLGRELHCYDALTDTVKVVNIRNTTLGAYSYDNAHDDDSSLPEQLTVYNNKLYFVANEGTHGHELWVYDGTNDPTMVFDLNPTETRHKNTDAAPKHLTVYNNKLYFSADDGTHGHELWVYDGTNTPTMVADININEDSYNYGSPDIVEQTQGSEVYELVVYNNKLYFGADDGTSGMELWVYDGTNTPTMVADIRPGICWGWPCSSWPGRKIVYNNKLYFVANEGTHGAELWVYDGTNTPTMVADIKQGSDGSYPEHMAVYNNKLYFSADDGTHGRELWVYDSTNADIAPTLTMVADIAQGLGSSSPSDLTVYNNKLCFRATDAYANGDINKPNTELWVYDDTVHDDGTVTAPTMVADVWWGSPGGLARHKNYGRAIVKDSSMVVYNNKLYFGASDGSKGHELHAYDGTTISIIHDVVDGTIGDTIYGWGPIYGNSSGAPDELVLFSYSPPPESLSPTGLHLTDPAAQLVFGPEEECAIQLDTTHQPAELIFTCDVQYHTPSRRLDEVQSAQPPQDTEVELAALKAEFAALKKAMEMEQSTLKAELAALKAELTASKTPPSQQF